MPVFTGRAGVLVATLGRAAAALLGVGAPSFGAAAGGADTGARPGARVAAGAGFETRGGTSRRGAAFGTVSAPRAGPLDGAGASGRRRRLTTLGCTRSTSGAGRVAALALGRRVVGFFGVDRGWLFRV
jgi:hypothetical protein